MNHMGNLPEEINVWSLVGAGAGTGAGAAAAAAGGAGAGAAGSTTGSSAGTSNWQRNFLSTTLPGAAFFQISSSGRAAFSSDSVWDYNLY